MKAISVLNLKGGVGKTVTAVNMAHILAAEHSKRVLLVDCDSQCNASEFFGLSQQQYALGGPTTLTDVLLGECEPYYGDVVHPTGFDRLDMIPASDGLMDLDMSHIADSRVNGRCLAEICEAIAEDDSYDFVIFDCPPAFNAASAAALLASDEVVVPIKLDAFSVRGLANVTRQIENIRRINPEIRVAGALVTMWRNTPVVVDAEQSLRSCALIPVFETVIRRTDKVDEMTFERQPIAVYSPRSAAGYDYRAWVQEYLTPNMMIDGFDGGEQDAV